MKQHIERIYRETIQDNALTLPPDVLSRMKAGRHDWENKEIVAAALEPNKDNQEIEVWCHFIRKQKKEEGIQNLYRQRFENELIKIESGLDKKQLLDLYSKIRDVEDAF